MKREQSALRALSAWSTLCVVVVLTGCGNLTAGGFGDVSVSVSGDAPVPAAVAAARAPDAAAAILPSAVASGPLAAEGSGDEPEGRLEVEFMLYLRDADGVEWALSEDQLEVQVDLRGRTEADPIDRLTLPANRYTQLKMVFLKIKAEVEGGLVINGTPVLGEVKVELEGPALEVSRSVDFDLMEGTSAELLIDLNAATWLQAVDLDLLNVAEQIFRDAIAVEVR